MKKKQKLWVITNKTKDLGDMFIDITIAKSKKDAIANFRKLNPAEYYEVLVCKVLRGVHELKNTSRFISQF